VKAVSFFILPCFLGKGKEREGRGQEGREERDFYVGGAGGRQSKPSCQFFVGFLIVYTVSTFPHWPQQDFLVKLATLSLIESL
jgi:hypothetical protein